MIGRVGGIKEAVSQEFSLTKTTCRQQGCNELARFLLDELDWYLVNSL